MEIELREIHDFIARHPPFHLLTPDQLAALIPHVSIRYLRRGQPFPPARVEEASFYLIRSGAVELRDAQGRLIDKLAEQDSYALPCGDENGTAPHAQTAEDTLLYVIPCKQLAPLRAQNTDFDRYFSLSAPQRMRLALEGVAAVAGEGSERIVMRLPVGDLTDRQPVMVQVGTSILETARLMGEENVSAVLVMEGENLVGILTDRDLRQRCIAAGVSRHTAVGDIISRDLVTVQEHTILADALMEMTRRHIHHLPVMRGEQPVGNLSVADIVRYLGTNAAFMASDIDRANSIEALQHVSARLPELQLQLVVSNTPARQMGEIISMISDAITRRLIALAETKLGPPPVPYVWLAGGSQGRNEQTAHTDQDNAILIADTMQDEHEAWFTELSRFVCDGLNTCGYIYCPGEAMASNPRWRKPLSTWRAYFNDWIERPQPRSLMLSSIFFDLRPVHGDSGLFEELQQTVLQLARGNRIFIAHLVSNALSHRPPLGFFRNFVLIHDQKHDHTLDIKHRGVVPVVDIARTYALSEGIAAVNTWARLEAAQNTGALSQEMGRDLVDAMSYITALRNRHQAEQIRQGLPADNYIDPRTLSGLERGHLKDAFAIIKTMQEILENRHQSGRLI